MSWKFCGFPGFPDAVCMRESVGKPSHEPAHNRYEFQPAPQSLHVELSGGQNTLIHVLILQKLEGFAIPQAKTFVIFK